MNDKDILANAPEGATHVDAAENYYVNDVCDWELIEAVKGNAFIYQDASISEFESMRSLADIQRIVELEAKNEKLKEELKYVDAKVKSATQCHPRAVEYLLDEALSRTHFDKTNEDAKYSKVADAH
ncbi:MAG: hypothetical protein ACKVI8_07050 [Paraglaciecola sp.]